MLFGEVYLFYPLNLSIGQFERDTNGELGWIQVLIEYLSSGTCCCYAHVVSYSEVPSFISEVPTVRATVSRGFRV
jgi:hypothetical protein